MPAGVIPAYSMRCHPTCPWCNAIELPVLTKEEQVAVEKTIRDKHEHALMQIEGLLHISPPRSPAQYRQRHSDEPVSGPPLYCGQKVVACVYKSMDVKGYLLCRILDWAENDGFWGMDTTIYMVPVESSHPNVDEHLMRVKHARYVMPRWRRIGAGLEITSFDPADMPRRVEAA